MSPGAAPRKVVIELPGKVVLALISPPQDPALFPGGEQRQRPGRRREDAGVHAQAEDPGKVQAPHLQEAQDLEAGVLHPRSGQSRGPRWVSQSRNSRAEVSEARAASSSGQEP